MIRLHCSFKNTSSAIGRVKNDDCKYQRDHPEHMADGALLNRMEVGFRLCVTVSAHIAIGLSAVFFLWYRLTPDGCAADISMLVDTAAGQAPAKPETDQVEYPIPAQGQKHQNGRHDDKVRLGHA